LKIQNLLNPVNKESVHIVISKTKMMPCFVLNVERKSIKWNVLSVKVDN
jgi:hypothetical protein